MVRISKQNERRQVSPKKYKKPAVKTGPKQDALPQGFKPLQNAIDPMKLGTLAYIPLIKSLKN